VDDECSIDHGLAIGLISHFTRGLYLCCINWRPGGALRWDWRPSVGKVEEWNVASWRLKGCSPYLCQLRTDGLAPTSNYWMYWSHVGVYGPSKPSSMPWINAWLKRTASMAVSREKLRWVPWTNQPGWEVESGALFLRSSSIRPMLLMTHERLLYVDCVKYVWSGTIRGLSTGGMWHIGRVFSCRVYIDSNCCDSQIWVTACLWPSAHN
jgi:hypothetical protein